MQLFFLPTLSYQLTPTVISAHTKVNTCKLHLNKSVLHSRFQRSRDCNNNNKRKKITVSYWFFLKPLNKNPDSDWLLTLHPSPLSKPVTQATSWCDWWENAMLHQRWLIINLHLIYLGIVVWKNKWRSPRRQGGELVVAVASSVSTLAALRTSCSLRAQTLTCLYSAS